MLYARIPNKLIKDKNITDATKFIYIALSLHCNQKTNQAFPNQHTIAKKYEIKQENISRSVKELVEKGYLQISKKVKKGKYASNIYTFVDDLTEKYTIVNAEILEKYIKKEISMKNLMFYVKIKRFINDNTFEMIYTTKTEVARIADVDLKTARKHLLELEKAKIIEIRANQYEENCIDIILKYEKDILEYDGIRTFGGNENEEKI